MKEPIIEGAEGWTVPLDGYSIERISIDSGFVILLLDHEPEGFELRIGGDFVVRNASNAQRFSPAMREHLGPALTCLSKNALRFTATRHGLGTLFLEDGSTIAVEPDRNYEAWELAGPRGCHLVCTPSGEIAYWSAKKDLPL